MIRSLLRVGVGAGVLFVVFGVLAGAAEPPKKTKRKQFPPATGPTSEDITCPYLRQKAAQQQAVSQTESDLGRDVLENLERLKTAEKLLKKATELAEEDRFAEAVGCCCQARDLCPGSCCAERASEMLNTLMDEMQSYARVRAFHKQSEDQTEIEYEWERIWYTDMPNQLPIRKTGEKPQPAGSSEASEPLTPPMPSADADVVPALDRLLSAKMKDRLDIRVNADGELRVRGACPFLGNVYHIQIGRGLMAIWKTPNAAKTSP